MVQTNPSKKSFLKFRESPDLAKASHLLTNIRKLNCPCKGFHFTQTREDPSVVMKKLLVFVSLALPPR